MCNVYTWIQHGLKGDVTVHAEMCHKELVVDYNALGTYVANLEWILAIVTEI